VRRSAARFLIVVATASLPLAAAYAAEKSPEAKLTQVLSFCDRSGGSNVGIAECLSGQIKRHRAEMGTAIRKLLFEIGDAANNDPSLGPPPATKKEVESRVASFRKEQAAWDDYAKMRCQRVVDEWEASGGNGGAITAATCDLRLIIQRIAEIHQQ
jgi:uncharacterized protein YecT (DUF1311 family)